MIEHARGSSGAGIFGPGYFGKVPARGDFISGRLPGEVVRAWDDWLTRLTVSVREAAGEGWPEAWLTAPLWHFTLGAEILEGMGCAAGVLVASVDRVGRMFPFTVMGSSDGVPEAAWRDAMEALLLESLEDGFVPELLEAQLEALGRPGWGGPIVAGTSEWWCRGADEGVERRVTARGLPGAEACVAMMLG